MLLSQNKQTPLPSIRQHPIIGTLKW